MSVTRKVTKMANTYCCEDVFQCSYIGKKPVHKLTNQVQLKIPIIAERMLSSNSLSVTAKESYLINNENFTTTNPEVIMAILVRTMQRRSVIGQIIWRANRFFI